MGVQGYQASTGAPGEYRGTKRVQGHQENAALGIAPPGVEQEKPPWYRSISREQGFQHATIGISNAEGHTL
jgi:hypothetical protein